jgi:hypothetical protein
MATGLISAAFPPETAGSASTPEPLELRLICAAAGKLEPVLVLNDVIAR